MSKSFLYANGVVSSLSKNLISKDTFVRMIDAKDNKEALSILQETNFGAGLTIDSPFDIEELLSLETKKLLKFVKEESPVEELQQYFLLQYDYKNIANFCKGLILEQDVESFVECEGNYEWLKIKDLISSKNFSGFNNCYIENALKDFQELASKTPVKGYEIDFLFKNYLYKNLKAMAKKNAIVKDIVNTRIDIENISNAMRSKTPYMFESQMLDGVLSKKVLTKIFNKDDSVLSEISSPILKKFTELALSENKESAYVNFEILKNTYVFTLLLPNKFNIDNLAPFAYYCFQKESEIKNVRLIMSYQNNNLKNKIRERFLEYYGG
ncbi:MAG: V-type ATPase subunit [Clostridia bacterium]|nr:V-type ATPase subunit [Clostridia bacterium]